MSYAKIDIAVIPLFITRENSVQNLKMFFAFWTEIMNMEFCKQDIRNVIKKMVL